MTIGQLRHDGYWRAQVSEDGQTINVDRKYGSWRVSPEDGQPHQAHQPYRDVLPEVAAALQLRVRSEERRAARDNDHDDDSDS